MNISFPGPSAYNLEIDEVKFYTGESFVTRFVTQDFTLKPEESHYAIYFNEEISAYRSRTPVVFGAYTYKDMEKAYIRIPVESGITRVECFKSSVLMFYIEFDVSETPYNKLVDLALEIDSWEEIQVGIHTLFNDHDALISDSIVQLSRPSTISRRLVDLYSNEYLRRGHIIGNTLFTEDFGFYYLGSFFEVVEV